MEDCEMKIKKVAVLGAGAVGSYLLWGISRLDDVKLGVVAEGERAERLKKGCVINHETYHPQVWTLQEAHDADLLVISLKYGALRGALEDIRTIVGEHTTVMSLMNGVDSEELIAEKVDKSHILYALMKIASRREGDGYWFNPDNTLGMIYGELEAPFDSERVLAINELFTRAGLHYRTTEYIIEEMWSKFRINVCNNLPQAVVGAGIGCYRDSEHIEAIRAGLRRELEAIAAAKGIDMENAYNAEEKMITLPDATRFSTLQDLDAGRHTEIDMFSGALVKMGKELGIPMPYNEYTYHIIKALEEKNDGKFDYT